MPTTITVRYRLLPDIVDDAWEEARGEQNQKDRELTEPVQTSNFANGGSTTARTASARARSSTATS